ncbi:hypothetical protein FS837_003328 [Tulasnella sp. UAMH 9824]|nr:hypothetical protein FS837_003328 [Tulasnella sp. UAMH 9824]
MEDNKAASQPISVQEASIYELEEAIERIRISPRKVLGSLGHLRIDKARLKPIEGKALDEGGTADVEAAILAPAQISNSSETEDTEYVAVKKLRMAAGNDDCRALALFAHEVNLLNELSHQNVVKIIGFVEDVEHGVAWMVFAWEKNGNLREFVRSASWELPERISLIGDVTKGLSYLHGRHSPICHGDMKSLNILVNSEHRAVITDFGSARSARSTSESTVEDVNTTKTPERQQKPAVHAHGAEPIKAKVSASGDSIALTGPAWTVRWAAPELLADEEPSSASDVWALGWICWEAVTGNFPFGDLEDRVAIIVSITGGHPPVVKNNEQLKQLGVLCNLMEQCWRVDAHDRPTALRCRQVISLMEQVPPSRKEGSDMDIPLSSRLLWVLGRMEWRNDKMPEARKYFQRALEVSQSVGDESGKARALKALGDACHRQNEHSEAVELLIQAKNIFSQIGDRLGFAQSVDSLGDVYRMRDEYSKAEESYVQAQGIYLELLDTLGLAQTAANLGDLYRLRDEYTKAEQSYTQARDLYHKIGSELGVAESVKGLGDVYRMRSEYSKAEESYKQASDIYSQIGNQLGFAQSVKSLGDVYLMRSEYSRAEESYNRAQDIYSQIGNQLCFSQSLQSLGDVFLVQGEYSKAEESYNQAREISSQIGDQLGFAQSVDRLGDIYLEQSDYSKAEESYTQARDIFLQIGDHTGLANSIQGLGRVQSARGEYNKAEDLYLEAQRIFHRIGERQSSANVSWYLGCLHYRQAEYGKAERLVREASSLYAELGLEQDMAQCDALLDVIFRLTDDSQT